MIIIDDKLLDREDLSDKVMMLARSFIVAAKESLPEGASGDRLLRELIFSLHREHSNSSDWIIETLNEMTGYIEKDRQYIPVEKIKSDNATETKQEPSNDQ